MLFRGAAGDLSSGWANGNNRIDGPLPLYLLIPTILSKVLPRDIPAINSTENSEIDSSRQAKLGTGGSNHEVLKLVNGILLVKVQPGQSRSGQAGSESCHSAG